MQKEACNVMQLILETTEIDAYQWLMYRKQFQNLTGYLDVNEYA